MNGVQTETQSLDTKSTMASTMYGKQFEALMAEVCRDFGAKLVKSWDQSASKDEVKDFVAEAVANFFSLEPVVEDEVEVEVESPKKKKKAAVKKGKAVAVDVEVVVENPAKKKGGKKKSEDKAEAEAPAKKGKAVASKGKPKCEAVTAKGAPCSKCAVEGDVFCNIHMKSKTKAVGKPKVVDAKGKKPSVAVTKKATKVSPPKHTHGLTSPPLKENPCELCETHGMPFEVPEYEEEIMEEEDPTDPDFRLAEEDFEDSDSDSGMDDLD